MSTASAAGTRGPTGADPRASRPLHAVLDALRGGATSVHDVAGRTGLPVDVVTGAVDHLARLGRLTVSTLTPGCPSGDCGTCPIPRTGAACGTLGREANRSGPVLVTVTVR